VPLATTISLSLAFLSALGSLLLDSSFFFIVIIYLGMNVLYSLKLKHMVILDVMCIAFGFLLRVLAGTTLVGVAASDWLIICTVTLSLFLGFSKRRYEVTAIGNSAEKHRQVLAQYSISFLDQMIAVATACTVMSYSLYTVSSETVSRFHTRHLILTVPFVLYGIYRYLYLIHEKEATGNPTSAVLKDRPLLVNCLLWGCVTFVIIYF
jgi:4-hydroxybenzoate polyprenyltransferase